MRRLSRRTLLILAFLVVLSPLLAFGCLWPGRPESLGVRQGRLSPCPSSPNCVSTLGEASEGGDHDLEPIPFTGSPETALDAVVSVVEALPGAELITRTQDYLHFEFTTCWMRFVDDVEFLIDESAGVVHFRSASRAGYSDLGVNRERMISIARLLGARLREETPEPRGS